MIDPSAALAQIRKEYAAKLPAKLAELSDAIRACTHNRHASVESARTLAHRLRGTAGSYGYLDVSAAVGEIEELLEDIAGGRDRWPDLEPALRKVLAFVREAP